MNILETIRHPQLFAKWFSDKEIWIAWTAFLAALFALPMTAAQLAIYRKQPGRQHPPAQPCQEAWLVCGRRAGKSFIMSLTGVYLATFRDYRQYLQPGERAVVALIAA